MLKKNSSIDDLILKSINDARNDFRTDQKNIDDLISVSVQEAKADREKSSFDRAVESLSEDVVGETLGDKKAIERLSKKRKKTDAEIEKEAEEHKKFLASIPISLSRIPGGSVDNLVNLASSIYTIPKYVLTGKETHIPSFADLTEKGLHSLTGDKLRKYGLENRSKDADWMQFLGEILTGGALFKGANAMAKGTKKALDIEKAAKLSPSDFKALGVGSTAKIASEKAFENLDQNTIEGRAAAAAVPFLVPMALSKNTYRKIANQLDKPPNYTKNIDLDAYAKNQELGAPRLISADANMKTPEGRSLAKQVQYHLENSPELQAVAEKGFDFYRDKFGVAGKDKSNPDKVAGHLLKIFEDKHNKVHEKSNKALEKVLEGLEKFSDKDKPNVSSKNLTSALNDILKNTDTSRAFFEMNNSERAKFINDVVNKKTGNNNYNFLDKSVSLASENDSRLQNSNALLPKNTMEALNTLYGEKNIPPQVNELFKVLDKNKGLTTIQQLMDWKKDYTQLQKKLMFDKDLDETASKFRIGKINKAVNDDIYSRLRDLDLKTANEELIGSKEKKYNTSREAEFKKYNDTYRNFFEELSPEAIRTLHRNSNSTEALFNLFTDALTEKQSTNPSKMRTQKSLNNFLKNIPKDVKKSLIIEMIFEMGQIDGERMWSPSKFRKKLFGMSELRQKTMNNLYRLAFPNNKKSLEDYAVGIHKAGNSLEFSNKSQSSVRNEITMKEMQADKSLQKFTKDLIKKGDPFSMASHAAGAAAVKLNRLARKKFYDKNFQSGETYDKAINKKIRYDQNVKSGQYKLNWRDLLNDLLIGTAANK